MATRPISTPRCLTSLPAAHHAQKHRQYRRDSLAVVGEAVANLVRKPEHPLPHRHPGQHVVDKASRRIGHAPAAARGAEHLLSAQTVQDIARDPCYRTAVPVKTVRPLDGCRREDSPLELRFVDRDGGVESVLVDPQGRVETVVLGVPDRDDLVMRADSVTACKSRLPILEFDVTAVAFDSDD